MKNISILTLPAILIGFVLGTSALAMELDWSGQFRSEFNIISNYSMDSSDTAANFDATRAGGNGYYVPGGGSDNANFQTLFLRLRPKLIVNDNIYIKSEWWLGSPVFGFFGNAVPYTYDQRQFYSTQSRGSLVSAQRFWADILTDFGTLQIGRAPLNWGLGIVWNSGDGLWDRYASTGDVIRLVSKFGSFTLTPSFISYSSGNNLGGSCTGAACTPGAGSGGVSDYSLMLKYENIDEDFEGGVNFVKRLAGANQDPVAGHLGLVGVPAGVAAGGSPASMNYNTWDLFGRKKLGKIKLGGELPIVTGNIGGVEYSTYAFAGEVDWKANDAWEFGLKAGHAPGQPNLLAAAPDRYKVFYFNPNYHLGMIMFNYQLANMAGPNTLNNPTIAETTLKSPYDNPIVNTNYLGLSGVFHTDKWAFRGAWVYAKALEAAVNGENFFNPWQRRVVGPAVKDQGTSLGWEMDLGATLQWDDSLQFGWDSGFFFPGDFFAFSNTLADNATSMVFATTAKIGIAF
ncbi:MAG: hypothetical protein AABZ06_08110 [Bdellovibrionota bacterium]